VWELSFLGGAVDSAHVSCDVVHKTLSLALVEDFVEKDGWLLIDGVRVSERISGDWARCWLSVDGVLLVFPGGLVLRGLIVGHLAITVHVHDSVTLVIGGSHSRSVWAVDWNLVVVGAEAMSVGIRVVDKSALEHLAVGSLDAWDEVGWGESGLLGLSVEVLWVLVEGKFADLDQGAVSLGPCFGDVIYVVLIFLTIFKGHYLNVQGPRWEVSSLDVFEEISGSEILVLLAHLSGFFGTEVLDALVSLEVVLNQEWLTLVVDPLVGVGAVSIQMAVTVWSSSVGEEDHDLMEGFWREGPEVPGHLSALDASLWVSLLTVDEVSELDGVSDEEHWCVVSDHVVVSLFGVELDGETAGISITVVGTSLTGNG